MGVTHFEHVRRPHWILNEKEDPRLPVEARAFWVFCLKATKAVLAYDGHTLIGFLRYQKGRALGTWVHPDYRREGVAWKLWDEMLAKDAPPKFHITTVSEEGLRFAQRLQATYGEVEWTVKRAKGSGNGPQ